MNHNVRNITELIGQLGPERVAQVSALAQAVYDRRALNRVTYDEIATELGQDRDTILLAMDVAILRDLGNPERTVSGGAELQTGIMLDLLEAEKRDGLGGWYAVGIRRAISIVKQVSGIPEEEVSDVSPPAA